MISRLTYLDLMTTGILASLNEAWSGTSTVTSNFGRTYSATWKVLGKTWSRTVTVMVHSPRTGDEESSSCSVKTPLVARARVHCFTRFPSPSFEQTANEERIIPKRAHQQRTTYGDVDVEGARDARPQMRVEDDHPELDLVTGLVDRLVRLDEHRVALVEVRQFRGVEEV